MRNQASYKELIINSTYNFFTTMNSFKISTNNILTRLGIFGNSSEGNSSESTGITAAEREANASKFLDTVKKGDILITDFGVGGLMGHCAIMISDYWVLDMVRSEDANSSDEGDNRRTKKCDWYDEYESGITVYRNRDPDVADAAADWAIRNYYNPFEGPEKIKQIKYRLVSKFSSMETSYCSKLVLQAFHFGTGDREVIRDLTLLDTFIVPSEIPKYFLSPYTLDKIGRF